MTRRRARAAAAGFGVIALFFALIAYFAGFQDGQHLAYGAAPDVFQDGAVEGAYVPLTAGNDAHRPSCGGGYGWGGRHGPQDDAFCHPFFKAAPQTPSRRMAALERANAPAPRIAPQQKPQPTRTAALDDAVVAAVAEGAGLSRAPKDKGGMRAPSVPNGIGLAPISPWFLTRINDEDSDEEGDAEGNEGGPPVGETPDVESPPTPAPQDPLPPLDPVEPDPFDPFYPDDPGLPTDPIVTPIPGAAVLWIAGLAALGLKARRKTRP